MKALLDTNIIIHRENTKATNYSIGQLFHWLDKMHYEKVLHPYTVKELRKLHNAQMQELYDAKLAAYTLLHTVAPQTDEFKRIIAGSEKTENDVIDNQLLCEVYSGRVDILITEDRKMRNKAELLGIAGKVFSINSFITKMTDENPALIEYKALSVKKTYFGKVNVSDRFFDSFRNSYVDFDKWFNGKSNEEAYICYNDKKDILGFLYLKTEYEDENYSDITPVFSPKKRLKVGTFKVESSGFRLGERFIKIIFDNALQRNVDEIYVTLFNDRQELFALKSLLERWGFFEYGQKLTPKGTETVLVKRLNEYDWSKSVKWNYPNIRYDHKKLFLPIFAQYHTRLFPDSKLSNEVELIGNEPQKYALQKVYVSFSFARNMLPGDLVLIYRPGTIQGRKGWESVVTTLCIVDDSKCDFSSEEEYLTYCENRTVFSKDELHSFWVKKNGKLLVIKLILVKEFEKKVPLNFLWNSGIVEYNSGPRSFDEISDESFKKIIDESGTKLFKDTSDTQAKIMLSIKPKYVEEIMAGRKKYEYRKRLAGESVKKIYIYETSPISKVVGEVDVEGVLTIPKDQLWEKTKYRSGISFEEYNEYFSCSDIGNAYILGKVTKYETPKSLESFGVSQPPQSFVYVNQS